MLDKLFNKKDPKSKVTKAEDTKKGVSSMRIIAKETLMFPSMAKQLRSLSNVFARYVKLHNIRPATPGSISDVKKSLSESKEIKVASIKVKKYGTEKKKTFLAGILDSIITIIKGLIIGTLLAGGYIVYKLIEIITPYVESLMAKAEEGITFISDGIKNFYENVNWLDLFVSSFKKYLSFISFGLISEEQVGNYISQAGSFYKETIGRIGSFLQMAVEWLSPRLQKVGRLFATNILGVDVDALAEKRKIKEELAESAKKLQKQYDELAAQEKTLVSKKDKLSHEKKIIEKQKEAEEKKKQVEEIEKAPKKVVPFLQRLFKREKKEPLPPIEDRSIPPAPPAPTPKAAPIPTPVPSVAASAPVTPPTSAPAPIAKEKPAPVGKPTPISDKPGMEGMEAPLTKTPSSVSLKSVVEDHSPFLPIDYSGLKPGFEKLLVGMAIAYTKETGKKLLINSAYRSDEEQTELYSKWLSAGKPDKGVVAKPKSMGGSGSPHTGGTAIDIQAKGQMFGKLSGDVDNPSGWLEKFGLTRPVTTKYLMAKGRKAEAAIKNREDWHVTPLGSAPIPDGDVVPTKSGKAVDLATGKEPEYDIGKSSAELAKEQRGQSKPQNPTYVNARTTNNVSEETKRTNVPVPA